jgi:hypothetical protein
MKDLFDKTWGSIASMLFTGWLVGNFLWMAIVHSLGNLLGVSWLEVDHALRVFSWSPTLKEIQESNMRQGKGDPEFWENVKW